MIYLDNAATGGFKPHAATEAAVTVIRYLCANPGRSGHRLSLAGEKIMTSCRETLAGMFSARPERVAFAKNCTEALNTAIFGTLKRGGHVITTVFEHNSVLRPLYSLYKKGEIRLDIVAPGEDGDIVSAIREKIRPDTYLVCLTAASNVTGRVFPVREAGKMCRERGILFLADGAQAAGHIPLSLKEDCIDMLALPGHKGLYGIMGSGALVFGESVDISPLTMGGTGTESYNLLQPEGYPERLEAGTVNLPAVAALDEGAKFANSNMKSFGRHLTEASERLILKLSETDGVTVYSEPNPCGIVALNIDGLPSAEAADILSREYDIAVRGGMHCAPLAHRFFGTEDGGMIRASLAVQNSYRETATFIKAVKEMADKLN